MIEMWRDIENNKVYVKCGTEITEVPHAIAEAYRQYEADCFRLYRAMADRSEMLANDNAKLRELVRNLRKVIPADIVGVVIDTNTDHPSYYKFEEAFRELKIEV